MNEIRIFNKRTYAKRDHPRSKTFYCGRRMRDIPGSPLANPFKIKGTVVTRPLSIKRYREYFYDMVNHSVYISNADRNKFMQALADICIAYQSGHDIDLLCWCSPLLCHCEIIKEYVLKVTEITYETH